MEYIALSIILMQLSGPLYSLNHAFSFEQWALCTQTMHCLTVNDIIVLVTISM